MTNSIDLKALRERITDYLGSGGFFNPELMEHGKVRDLLIDCRAALSAQSAVGESVDHEKRVTELMVTDAMKIAYDRGLEEAAQLCENKRLAWLNVRGDLPVWQECAALRDAIRALSAIPFVPVKESKS